MTDPRLEKWLAEGADERRLGGNEPFPLDAEETVWWIRAGQVEVFAVPQGETVTEGAGVRRTHVATFEAGEALFSLSTHRRVAGTVNIDQSAAPVTLVAVAAPGTRLIELPLAKLKAAARNAELTAGLVSWIETWLSRLFRDLQDERPPKVFSELQAGSETLLEEADAVGRSRAGVVWVRHVSGRSRFLGRDELILEPAGYLLPISDETWLVSAEPASLSCVTSAILLRGGGIWEGLDRFHQLFLAYVALQLAASERAEEERLARKAELDQKMLEAAYARLAAVLGGEQGAASELGDVDDPWLVACRLVAEAQHINLTPPAPSEAANDPLSRICAAARIRARRVILRDDWWRRDNGPLLAFLSPSAEGEAARPVALLPLGPRRYEMVDPGEGRRLHVDEAIAETLAGEAFMFYTPFPERPLNRRDLLRAALRDRQVDLRTILLMGAGAGVLGLLVPIITGYLFGRVIPSADRPQLFQMTIALVLSAFAAAGFQITRSIAILRLGGKIDGSLQSAVWDRLLSLPVRFFRDYTVGDLTDRAMGIDAIRELLTGHVITSLLAVVYTLTSFALLFYYSWRLALVATLLVVVLILVTSVFSVLQVKYQRRLLELRGKIASLLFGLIHGVSKLRIGGAEPRAFALWAERFTAQRQETLAAQRVAIYQGSFNAAYALLSAMGLFAMVGFSDKVELTVSTFLAFNAAYGQFQAAIQSIVTILPGVLTAIPIYERLKPILEAAPEVDPSKAEVGELAGDIEFSHISFRYQADGPLILDDISLRARPGEFIALVGPSGSGKSTCLRLILGFEQPAAGSIYFDGQDLPSLDMLAVRRQIGVVLQGGRPMVGDIFSNIVGSRQLTMDDAWEAARMAGLDEDIKAMPMGMHTVISEGAGTFSGGQQQRLMIARAIVHRPRILLFDEATSALDNRTQEIVSQSLERLKATRIVVAHRLSTIINADRIYVIEKGRVVEEGSYEELVEHGGLFSRLAARQIA